MLIKVFGALLRESAGSVESPSEGEGRRFETYRVRQNPGPLPLSGTPQVASGCQKLRRSGEIRGKKSNGSPNARSWIAGLREIPTSRNWVPEAYPRLAQRSESK